MPCLELRALCLSRIRSGSRPSLLDAEPRGCRRLWVGRLPSRIPDETWKCSFQPGAPYRRRLELLSGAPIMVCLMGSRPHFSSFRGETFFFLESGIKRSGRRYTQVNASNLTEAGNAPGQRVERLKAFWERITAPSSARLYVSFASPQPRASGITAVRDAALLVTNA
jgi:hypothetical protein